MTITPEAQDPLADALDRVSAAISDSTLAARDTATAVRATEARRRRNTILGGCLAGIAAIVLVAVLVTLLQVQSTQRAIKDCTDLTRRSAECARQAQKNSNRTINAIAQGQLTASYVANLCAATATGAPDYRACVEDELRKVADGTSMVPTVPPLAATTP